MLMTKTKTRSFDSGATRDSDDSKLDFEGFLSPAVLERYAQYMNKHRIQSDGTLRDSDNWQKGMPEEVYVKSLLRHVWDLWLLHRGYKAREPKEDALCAIMFNAMGLLNEQLRVQTKDA